MELNNNLFRSEEHAQEWLAEHASELRTSSMPEQAQVMLSEGSETGYTRFRGYPR